MNRVIEVAWPLLLLCAGVGWTALASSVFRRVRRLRLAALFVGCACVIAAGRVSCEDLGVTLPWSFDLITAGLAISALGVIVYSVCRGTHKAPPSDESREHRCISQY